MRFDRPVVLACHSNQALSVLGDATEQEKAVLSAIPYSENSVILHTDQSILPKQKRAWASWNYLLANGGNAPPVLTYNMNILQSLECPQTVCVTVNGDSRIDESTILGKYRYAHPQFSTDSVDAQNNWTTINGQRRTWYCGAYWGNGFHEDGVTSGIRVAAALGVDW